jgi:uncharacterized OB-fold protein
MRMPVKVRAVDGWFTLDEKPVLLGNRCTTCRTVFFPKTDLFCRNPECDGETFEEARLSRVGRIWSYTDAQYQPPPPYVANADTYEPFAIAAVELADEQIVVLGQLVTGTTADQLAVGQRVELVLETLFSDNDHEFVVYKWRPTAEAP